MIEYAGRLYCVDRCGRRRIDEVGAQHGIERHIVAHHADHRRRVIVQGDEHRLIAIGPRRRHVADGVVVELRIVGCHQRRLHGARRGEHLGELCRRRRHPGDAVVHARRLVGVHCLRVSAGARQCECTGARRCFQHDLYDPRHLRAAYELPHWFLHPVHVHIHSSELWFGPGRQSNHRNPQLRMSHRNDVGVSRQYRPPTTHPYSAVQFVRICPVCSGNRICRSSSVSALTD